MLPLLADAGPSRAAPRAGDPYRRHQRQGLHHRLPARHARGRAAARVNVYTSPHLVTFHERIRLGAGRRRPLSSPRRSWSTTLVEMRERSMTAQPITHFEITTAARLRAVRAAARPMCTLLEVGLGGRYDATNVIDAARRSRSSPRCRWIMTEFLGDTHRRRSRPRRPASSSAAGVVVGAAARRRARGDRARGGSATARRSMLGNRDWIGPCRARAAACSRTRTGCSTCRRRRLARPPSVRQCRQGHRRAAPPSLGVPVPGDRDRADQTADWPARMQRLTAGTLVEREAPATPRFGSTAATIPAPARSSPRRWPISRSGCRGRSI